MPGKRMSREERSRVLECARVGEPLRDICARFNRAKATILRLLKRAKHMPLDYVPPPKHASGRPRKLGKGMLRLMKLSLLKNPWLTAAEIKNMYPKELKEVSIRTIQRRCAIDLGLPIRRAAKKTLITRRMRIQRLKFAREMSQLTEED